MTEGGYPRRVPPWEVNHSSLQKSAMLTGITPKLPMRSKAVTRDFYLRQLGLTDIGCADFDGYLLVKRDNIEIHFLN